MSEVEPYTQVDIPHRRFKLFKKDELGIGVLSTLGTGMCVLWAGALMSTSNNNSEITLNTAFVEDAFFSGSAVGIATIGLIMAKRYKQYKQETNVLRAEITQQAESEMANFDNRWSRIDPGVYLSQAPGRGRPPQFNSEQ